MFFFELEDISSFHSLLTPNLSPIARICVQT